MWPAIYFHVLAAGLAVLVLCWHPRAPSLQYQLEPGAVSAAAALDMTSILWVDARASSSAAVPVLGAVVCNEDSWDEGLDRVLDLWRPGMTILVACDNTGCQASKQVAERLRQDLGVEQVFYVAGGWPAVLQAKSTAPMNWGQRAGSRSA